MSGKLIHSVAAVCVYVAIMGGASPVLGQDAVAPVAAPTEAPPPPPPASEVDSPPVSVPTGQWVFTNQYGWVFMPYAEGYTYVPDDGYPFMFVYGPSWGWRWLSAPWVLGLGPRPYWGAPGFSRFAWHARPWFAPRSHFAAAPYRMHAGGHGFGGHGFGGHGFGGHHGR